MRGVVKVRRGALGMKAMMTVVGYDVSAARVLREDVNDEDAEMMV